MSVCSACGQDCHCGRLYTDHRCGAETEAPQPPPQSSGTCCVCGVSAEVANVRGGVCVSRVMCAQRHRAKGR